MTWRGYELKSPPMQDQQVERIKRELWRKYQWCRDGYPRLLDEPDIYELSAARAVGEFQERAGLLAAGTAERGICNAATQYRIGVADPPAPARHVCFTARGTGGVVGHDYTSRVAQACANVVEEHPILYPATMGPAPVGAATQLNALSGQQSVDVGVEMLCEAIESSRRSFVLGGYSAGAIVTSKVRAMLLPGGRLADHAHRYVCGFAFGNPCRAFGHTFYLGPIPAGQGISDFHLPQDACTWDWCELVHPGDLYANAPAEKEVWEVCAQAYRLVMDLQIHDLRSMVQEFVRNFMRLLDEAGVEIPLGILVGVVSGTLGQMLPTIAGGVPEAAAALKAAIAGIRFATANPPTRDHIFYEWDEVLPGRTYVDLAVQHVTDWAERTKVLA